MKLRFQDSFKWIIAFNFVSFFTFPKLSLVKFFMSGFSWNNSRLGVDLNPQKKKFSNDVHFIVCVISCSQLKGIDISFTFK